MIDSTEHKRRQIVVIVAAFGVLILTSTVGFMVIEGWNLIDSVYMTVITISTVGFREVHVMSPAGRVFASFVILAGVGTAVYSFTRIGQFLLALLPSDAENLYLTMSAKSMNPEIRVIARGRDERAEMKLTRVGADRVVSPYLMAAARVLNAAVKPMVVEFMELVTHRQHLPLRLEEIVVSESSTLRGRFGVIVVAVKTAVGEMKFNPAPDQTIAAGDVLIAMGEPQELDKFELACGGEV